MTLVKNEKILSTTYSKDIADKFESLGIMSKKEAHIFMFGDKNQECYEEADPEFERTNFNNGMFCEDENGFFLTINHSNRESEVGFYVDMYHGIESDSPRGSYRYYEDGRVVKQKWILHKEWM